jgi:transposase
MKWIVVFDGQDVPLGSTLASASPAEVKLEDGRKLRRYRKCWKVERTFAWLGNFRPLVVRYERKIKMYWTFFHLACLIIVLNRF